MRILLDDKRVFLIDQDDRLLDHLSYDAPPASFFKARYQTKIGPEGSIVTHNNVEYFLGEKLDHYQPGQDIIVAHRRAAQGKKRAEVRADLALSGRWLVYHPLGKGLRFSRRLRAHKNFAPDNFSSDFFDQYEGGWTLRQSILEEGAKWQDEAKWLFNLWQKNLQAVEKNGEAIPFTPQQNFLLAALQPGVTILDARHEGDVLAKDSFDQAPAFHDAHWQKLEKGKSIEDIADLGAQLAALSDPVVITKEGLRLTFEKTEALWAVDLDAFQFQNNAKAFDDLAFAANMAALPELFRQIRLRQISGLILIDWLRVKSPDLLDKLLKKTKNLAKLDPRPLKIYGVTPAGLLEASRAHE